MRVVEDLLPLRLYPASNKFYIPINEKDKKKGSVIFLLTQSLKSSQKLMKLPYVYNPNFFNSIFIDRDVNALVNYDGALTSEMEEDPIEEAAIYESSIGFTDNEVDSSDPSVYKIEFKNATATDKAEISKHVNNKIIRELSSKLGGSVIYGGVINIIIEKDASKFDSIRTGKAKVLSINDRQCSIVILNKPAFKKVMESVLEDPSDAGRIGKLYKYYVQHEVAELLIYNINPRCNSGLASVIASYVTNEYKQYNGSEADIRGSQIVGDSTKGDSKEIRRIIVNDDVKKLMMYASKSTYNKALALFEAGVFDKDKLETLRHYSDKFGITKPKDDSTDTKPATSSTKFNKISKNPKELVTFMRDIKTSAHTKLQSHNALIESKSGSSHDQAQFMIAELRKQKVAVRGLFMREYDPDVKSKSGATYSIVYYTDKESGELYWIENCIGSHKGINGPYDSVEDLKKVLQMLHQSRAWGDVSSYSDVQISTLKHLSVGMTLTDIINEHISSSVSESKCITFNNTADENLYNSQGYLLTEGYLRFKDDNGADHIQFFNEEASDKYDMKLRRYLYAERLKNNKMLLDRYKEIKALNPWVKRTYLRLDMYRGLNVFVDLSYYHALFLKNNVLKMDKAVRMYWDFVNRIINNSEINQSYPKQTIFIPIDRSDWPSSPEVDILDWKKTLNPLSMLHRMIRLDPKEVQEKWGNKKIIFCSSKGYFTIDFSTFDIKNLPRFKTLIQVLINKSSKEIEQETNGYENNADSPAALAISTADKIEKATGYQVQDHSQKQVIAPVMDINYLELQTAPLNIGHIIGASGAYIAFGANAKTNKDLLTNQYIADKKDITGYVKLKK